MSDEDPDNAAAHRPSFDVDHIKPLRTEKFGIQLKTYHAATGKELAEFYTARVHSVEKQSALMAYMAIFKVAAAVTVGQATPKVGFLDWVLKPSDAEDARANLDEVMPMWMDRHGMKAATWLYKWQAGRIAVRYVHDRLLGQAERLIKLVRLGL